MAQQNAQNISTFPGKYAHFPGFEEQKQKHASFVGF